MSHGRTPINANSTILLRTQSGSGRPLTNTPPNWLTPAWPAINNQSKQFKYKNEVINLWNQQLLWKNLFNSSNCNKVCVSEKNTPDNRLAGVYNLRFTKIKEKHTRHVWLSFKNNCIPHYVICITCSRYVSNNNGYNTHSFMK